MLDAVVSELSQLIRSGDVYTVLLPIYVLLLGGERIAHALLSDRPWNDRDGAANLVITVAYLALDAALGAFLPLGLMIWLYDSARLFALPQGWGGWALAFLLHDLAWYVDHRLGHRVGFLWAMHHVHHSSQEFNMTVASRGFLLDESIARPLFYLLPIFGVMPLQFIVIRIVVSIWGIAQHTRLVPRLGVLDRWLATPSSHRVHHGSDSEYLDRNYGEVFMIWDRLLGTYTPEEREPRFGVTEPIDTYNPVKIQLAGFRWLGRRIASAERWSDKLKYLVMPPEWEHRPSEVRSTARATAVG